MFAPRLLSETCSCYLKVWLRLNSAPFLPSDRGCLPRENGTDPSRLARCGPDFEGLPGETMFLFDLQGLGGGDIVRG